MITVVSVFLMLRNRNNYIKVCCYLAQVKRTEIFSLIKITCNRLQSQALYKGVIPTQSNQR